MAAGRSRFRWMAGVTLVVVCTCIVWAILVITNAVQKGVDEAVHSLTRPGVPERGAVESAAIELTASGVPLTIKQRRSAWLPGGKYKLHLDDITGRQVLISVTDQRGDIVMGPRSVRADDTVSLEGVEPAMVLEVLRLKNLLTGEDFGEFLVKPGDPEQ